MNNENIISEEKFDQVFKEESSKIEEQLKKTIKIVLVGDVNCGKSSTINKLMQKDITSVGAKPGETVSIKEIKFSEKITFVDTPGLHDIETSNSEVTKNYYKQADVILFFLNAAGTVFSENELKSLKEIEKFNKDIIIVLNKIDATDEEERPNIIKYIKEKTNNNYKIAAISSRTGENIVQLHKFILDILKKKAKDLVYSKEAEYKSNTANNWIKAAGASAAAIGAAPIPGSDFVPLTGLQVGLMIKLSLLYDKPVSKEKAKEIILATIVGNIGKTAARNLIKFIPGAGSIIGASVAGATTLAFGYAIKYCYEEDIELDIDSIKFAYDMFMKNPSSSTEL